ncbi:PAS domain S-box protein, partial [Desulfosarcina sp. OttesenSCG-928-G17]|nr:PAS domain S-box protein [Desulfosarcina sp. OttesenSCG-928-G17]
MTAPASQSPLEAFFHQHRRNILEKWVHRLHIGVCEKYSERPVEELHRTVSDAYEGNIWIVLYDDPSKIDEFIRTITAFRLNAGFLLSHVQTAFELFREIVTPLIFADFPPDQCHDHIVRVNRCMAYVVQQHSLLSQTMHEKRIREHNLSLKGEVKRRTAELAESERKYKTLVEEINDGYVVIRDETIVFANPAFAKIHQLPENSVVGRKFVDFVAPGSRKKITDMYQRGMLIGKLTSPKAFEYMRLNGDGRTFPTEILSRVTHYDDYPSTIAICRDITERVKMEAKVREAERMATIGQITASLSHEIRNPLSAIKLNLQVLKKNALLQGNDGRRLDISVQEVKRLERILQELLDFAKPLDLSPRPVDIQVLMYQYTELLAEKFREKSIVVRFQQDVAMPKVPLDAERFQQAVMNLLLNAIDASPQGGEIRISIGVVWKNAKRYAAVRIHDQGCGIPADLIHEIRKPFFTTKTKG